MMRSCVLLIVYIVSVEVAAQKIPLIKSGEVLDKGNELYDSAKYDEAIQEYLKIPKRDTNYVAMLYKLAVAYSTNKNYDSASSTFKRVLANSIDFRARVLRSQAISLVNSGALDQGFASFEEAIQQYPIDQNLLVSKGAKYYDQKEYVKAKDIYFQLLRMNPFNSNAHLNLALLSMGEGRKAHAMLSMGIYLAIQPKDNPRLVLLNNFLDNQLQDEGTLPASGANASEKLDQIIRAKIALEKNFKSQIPISAAVVKQYELLFDQLALLSGNKNDEWANYYLPIYKAIKDQQQIQPFIYHLLTSSSNEVATKWRNKNEKELSALFENANQQIKAKAQKITFAKYNFTTPVSVWRDESGLIDALGEKNNDVRVGRWVFFHDNSELQAEGTHNDKGVKVGTWKYYYNTSEIKSIENYETGEVTVYNLQGAKREYFFLKDDEIQGEAILYYSCGPVSEKITYEKGKRHGLGQSFYISGKPYQSYTYKDGKLEGEVFTYFENGVRSSQLFYKEGALHGSYTEHYDTGVKEVEGNYSNGNPTGLWKYYHSNGKATKGRKLFRRRGCCWRVVVLRSFRRVGRAQTI